MRLSEAEAVDSFYSEVRWEVEDTAQLKSSEDGVSCIGAITHGQPPFRFLTSPSPLALPSFPSFQKVRADSYPISFPSPTVALADSRSQASGLVCMYVRHFLRNSFLPVHLRCSAVCAVRGDVQKGHQLLEGALGFPNAGPVLAPSTQHEPLRTL